MNLPKNDLLKPICLTGGFNGIQVQLVDGTKQFCKKDCNLLCINYVPRSPFVTYIPWFEKTERRLLYKPKTNLIPCNLYDTQVIEIVSPVTGRTWMDRNLGAWRAATNPTDDLAYGDLYQFGRRNDGHQCRRSLTSNNQTLSNLVSPPNVEKFIAVNPWTLLSPQTLWNPTNTGLNDVICPPGFRIPTQAEWQAERIGWGPNKVQEAFDTLKLTMAGFRISNTPINEGLNGWYHSSTTSSNNVIYLTFNAGPTPVAILSHSDSRMGKSVRCIKN